VVREAKRGRGTHQRGKNSNLTEKGMRDHAGYFSCFITLRGMAKYCRLVLCTHARARMTVQPPKQASRSSECGWL
jgi:hypothetical protein